MTRIAIIGNSHIAAFKEVIACAGNPALHRTFSFFGVHNQDFFRSKPSQQSALRLADPQDIGADTMICPTGSIPLDLDPFDQILLASHGFYLPSYYSVLASHDILDLEPAGHNDLLSWPMLQQVMRARIQEYIKKLKHFYRPDSRFTVLQMPFPAEQAVTALPDIAGTCEQPDLGRIIGTFNTMLCEEMETAGLNFTPVPSHLLATPMLTQGRYARATTLPEGTPPTASDYTHMNQLYALAVLQAALAAPGMLSSTDTSA